MDFVFEEVDKCKSCDVDVTTAILGDFGLFIAWLISNKNINYIYEAGAILDTPLDFTKINFPETIKRSLGFDRMNNVMEQRNK